MKTQVLLSRRVFLGGLGAGGAAPLLARIASPSSETTGALRRDIVNSPGRNIQLIPYGLFSHSRYLDTAPWHAPRFQTENEFRAGLGTKIVLKDAFTVDVTLNPDFGSPGLGILSASW